MWIYFSFHLRSFHQIPRIKKQTNKNREELPNATHFLFHESICHINFMVPIPGLNHLFTGRHHYRFNNNGIPAIQRSSKLWFLNWQIWIMGRTSVLTRNPRQSMTWIFFRWTVSRNALPCSGLPLLFCSDFVLSPGSTKISKSQYLSSPPPSPVVKTDKYGDSNTLWAPTQTRQCFHWQESEKNVTEEGNLDLSLRKLVGFGKAGEHLI